MAGLHEYSQFYDKNVTGCSGETRRDVDSFCAALVLTNEKAEKLTRSKASQTRFF